jgi:DNA (cytosine-5)-methyltransferase 1
MNPTPKITELARCITARQDSGISKHKGEHSGVLVIIKELSPEEVTELIDANENHWIFENEQNDRVTALILSDLEGHIFVGYIRKLTPRECWRLQGFTDEQFDKVAAQGLCDGDLYKMAGNAVSVPVISALGEIIKKVIEGDEK